jgi:hypothetical protein
MKRTYNQTESDARDSRDARAIKRVKLMEATKEKECQESKGHQTEETKRASVPVHSKMETAGKEMELKRRVLNLFEAKFRDLTRKLTIAQLEANNAEIKLEKCARDANECSMEFLATLSEQEQGLCKDAISKLETEIDNQEIQVLEHAENQIQRVDDRFVYMGSEFEEETEAILHIVNNSQL